MSTLESYVYHTDTAGSIYLGDCREVMAAMEPDSIDTVITDPPYGLSFMGKAWDHGVPGVEFWQAVLRVAKPGAMLLAFGGTRTHHRLMCAIEDAGWEIRDCIMWMFGSGLPKSHDISKAIDKAAGAKRRVVGEYIYPDGRPRNNAEHQTTRNGIYSDIKTDGSKNDPSITAPATPEAQLWNGWGTALKPAVEYIILAMKPIDGTFANNALTHGVAGLNADGGRIPNGGSWDVKNTHRPNQVTNNGELIETNQVYGKGWKYQAPDISQGRWPANVILDEEAAAMLDEQSGVLLSKWSEPERGTGQEIESDIFRGYKRSSNAFVGDSGGASRFFYCAKASRSERNRGLEDVFWDKRGETPVRITAAEWTLLKKEERSKGNDHPTVKPLKLMEYLCKLTATPTGGTILDPFAGSFTTALAARNTGRPYIAIELDEHNCEIGKRRLAQDVLNLQTTKQGIAL